MLTWLIFLGPPIAIVLLVSLADRGLTADEPAVRPPTARISDEPPTEFSPCVGCGAMIATGIRCPYCHTQSAARGPRPSSPLPGVSALSGTDRRASRLERRRRRRLALAVIVALVGLWVFLALAREARERCEAYPIVDSHGVCELEGFNLLGLALTLLEVVIPLELAAVVLAWMSYRVRPWRMAKASAVVVVLVAFRLTLFTRGLTTWSVPLWVPYLFPIGVGSAILLIYGRADEMVGGRWRALPADRPQEP